MKSGSGGVPDPPRAGRSFDEELVGPSSGAWGRAQGEYCRVAFFTTDGGTTSLPADGVLRPAKILRVEFEKGPEAHRSDSG